MALYPSTPVPEAGSRVSTYIPVVKTESDGNYIRARRKTTRARKKFELTYPNITKAEWDILQTFFEENQGVAFTYIDECTNVSYNCVFSMEELDITKNATTFSTKVVFEEI